MVGKTEIRERFPRGRELCRGLSLHPYVENVLPLAILDDQHFILLQQLVRLGLR